MQKTRHYLVLDGLRGVAALIVALYHFDQGTLLTLTAHGAKWSLFGAAYLAVDFFFMLSGFVIAHAYGARLTHGLSVPDYLLKRVIRLYPFFLLGLLIGTPVLYAMIHMGEGTYSLRGILGGLIYNAAGLPFLHAFDAVNMGAVTASRGEVFPANPPAWSLFFEMIASVAFIGLIRLRTSTLLRVIYGSFAAMVALGFLNDFLDYHWSIEFGLGWGSQNLLGGLPRVLFGFSMGIVLYRLHLHKYIVARLCRIEIKSSYLLYLLLGLVLLFPKNLKGLYPTFALFLAAPWIILTGARMECRTRVEAQIARTLGWLSYPVYCLHFPIGRAVWLIGRHWNASPAAIVGGSLISTLILSTICAKLIEEPARAFLSRRAFQPRLPATR